MPIFMKMEFCVIAELLNPKVEEDPFLFNVM